MINFIVVTDTDGVKIFVNLSRIESIKEMKSSLLKCNTEICLSNHKLWVVETTEEIMLAISGYTQK